MKSVITLLFAVTPALVHSGQLQVPGSYSSIQAAISAAKTGDTVLVAHGVYYENIRFAGKKITVASRFILTGDPGDIHSTVINGSKPTHADTASCVLFIDHETRESVLSGFTLTGGTGTRWTDEHGAGVYREGGGILSAFASPTISFNRITGNTALWTTGLASSGGGGIRAGDGSPLIRNNVIDGNSGLYGGGLVLNYCSGAIVSNNILIGNRVYQASPGIPAYGGGGIWVNNVLPGNNLANQIRQNTIISNRAEAVTGSNPGAGGGLLLYPGSKVELVANIFRNNHQVTGTEIQDGGNTLIRAEYNSAEALLPGTGNSTLEPRFGPTGLVLKETSPLVDQGDPAVQDPADPVSPEKAKLPARGGLISDPGAYGGPWSSPLPVPDRFNPELPVLLNLGNGLPGKDSNVRLSVTNGGTFSSVLTSIQIPDAFKGELVALTGFPAEILPAERTELEFSWIPLTEREADDSLVLIFLNQSVKLRVKGNSVPTPVITLQTALLNLGDADLKTARLDTAVWVANTGTGPDSVTVTLDPKTLPPAACEIVPFRFSVGPNDSVRVGISFFPQKITKAGVVSALFSFQPDWPGSTRLDKRIRIRFTGTPVGVTDREAEQFRLVSVYPNPFNPETTLRFNLKRAGEVTFQMYSADGRLVREEKTGFLSAGIQTYRVNAEGMSSGIYFFRLAAEKASATGKFVVLK